MAHKLKLYEGYGDRQPPGEKLYANDLQPVMFGGYSREDFLGKLRDCSPTDRDSMLVGVRLTTDPRVATESAIRDNECTRPGVVVIAKTEGLDGRMTELYNPSLVVSEVYVSRLERHEFIPFCLCDDPSDFRFAYEAHFPRVLQTSYAMLSWSPASYRECYNANLEMVKDVRRRRSFSYGVQK